MSVGFFFFQTKSTVFTTPFPLAENNLILMVTSTSMCSNSPRSCAVNQTHLHSYSVENNQTMLLWLHFVPKSSHQSVTSYVALQDCLIFSGEPAIFWPEPPPLSHCRRVLPISPNSSTPCHQQPRTTNSCHQRLPLTLS